MKWCGFRPVPPQLLPVDGVPLLVRTIRQVRRFADDIHVTVPPNDWRFRLAGVVLHERGEDYPSEYASTRDLWNESGRTVLLLGDVYWGHSAIETVMACDVRDYRVFGRFKASRVLGTPAGEVFAASWWPHNHAALDRHLDIVHRTRAAGTVTRPPGWMLLRSWQGTPLAKHRVRQPWWIEIDDGETDDIDRPQDYERHPAFGGSRARH